MIYHRIGRVYTRTDPYDLAAEMLRHPRFLRWLLEHEVPGPLRRVLEARGWRAPVPAKVRPQKDRRRWALLEMMGVR